MASQYILTNISLKWKSFTPLKGNLCNNLTKVHVHIEVRHRSEWGVVIFLLFLSHLFVIGRNDGAPSSSDSSVAVQPASGSTTMAGLFSAIRKNGGSSNSHSNSSEATPLLNGSHEGPCYAYSYGSRWAFFSSLLCTSVLAQKKYFRNCIFMELNPDSFPRIHLNIEVFTGSTQFVFIRLVSVRIEPGLTFFSAGSGCKWTSYIRTISV